MTPGADHRERGAALLTVLLLITVLSGLAVAMTDDIRFAVRRASNMERVGQAQWYALGAETLAKQVLHRSWEARPGVTTLNDPWAAEGVRYAIDGGSIGGELSDAGNCFNLNSVVTRIADGRWAAAPDAVAQYERLLRGLDADGLQAASLAAALVDWIDSDSALSPGGAEDETYGRRDPPYRAANTLMAEPSELRAVSGYTAEIYRRVRPYVCALPEAAPTRLNVNTLRPADAILLLALTDQQLRLPEAERLIARRPLNGYASAEAFLADDALAGIRMSEAVRRQFTVRTRYFAFTGTVQLHQASVVHSALMEVDDSGRVVVHARRRGAFE
jgi:general secretion pathway protein K